MARIPLTLASAALSCLTALCGSGESGGTSATLNTESYLGQAVDPERLFRWTPREDGEPIEVLVEVLNAPSELPAALVALGYDSARCATAVRDGFEAWAAHAGESIHFTLVQHSEGVTVGEEEVRIEVRFEEFDGEGLEGFTEVVTPVFDLDSVSCVIVRVRVGSGPGLTGEMVYSLLLHEFGHALGIVAPSPFTGHSERAGDVMFPIVRWGDLSNQDRLAISELYALQPNLRRADEAPDSSDPTGGDDDPWGWGWAEWQQWVRMRSAPATLQGHGRAAVEPALVRCGCEAPPAAAASPLR